MEHFDEALAHWAPFFGAQVPAGAAFLGLLFVALSLNLARIIAEPGLSRRAEIALMLIVLNLVVASCGLIPDQSARAFAIEVLLAAGFVWVVTLGLTRSLLRHTAEAFRGVALMNLALLQITVLPFVAGGVLLLLGSGAALHFIAAGMILGIAKAALDAWALLVEINR
jgi:modulator of FtsH protease